jgi:hypothetical protein
MRNLILASALALLPLGAWAQPPQPQVLGVATSGPTLSLGNAVPTEQTGVLVTWGYTKWPLPTVPGYFDAYKNGVTVDVTPYQNVKRIHDLVLQGPNPLCAEGEQVRIDAIGPHKILITCGKEN